MLANPQSEKLVQDLGAALVKSADQNGALSDLVKQLSLALELDRRRVLWVPCSSRRLTKDLLVCPGPAVLQSIVAYNAGAANFLQCHDTPSAVNDGPSCFLPPMLMPTQSTEWFDFGPQGAKFSQGIYVCASSTDVAKTLIVGNDVFIYALYRLAA